MLMRKINTIIIHCSATPSDMDIGADEIRKWHKDRGWRDIGYNYVIRRDGTLELGRDLDGDGNVDEEVGAHARGFNSTSIGICLIGGLSSKGEGEANFTYQQYKQLHELVFVLDIKYNIEKVMGHRDLPGVSKECPCFDVSGFFEHKGVL